VASSDSWRSGRVGAGAGAGPRDPNPLDEDGAIEEFFGQLWFFPSEKKTTTTSSRVSQNHLVWIHRDLWKTKSFSPEDCYPISSKDKWEKSPERLNLAEEIWGKTRGKASSEQ
jgi:hypothetical protein